MSTIYSEIWQLYLYFGSILRLDRVLNVGGEDRGEAKAALLPHTTY